MSGKLFPEVLLVPQTKPPLSLGKILPHPVSKPTTGEENGIIGLL
jgi:hypothetical protein